MILYTDSLFITDEQEGFRICRETRTSSVATMSVILCTAGYIDVYYHGSMLRINKNDMFVRIPDFTQPVGPYEMSPDFEFMQVTIDAGIYEQIMFDHMRVEPDWWAKQEYVKANPIFPINEVSRDFFKTYFHLITLQLSDKQTEYRKQVLMLIARGALLELMNYMDKLALVNVSTRATITQSDYLFHRFVQLLQAHPHEREVQWYAKEMGITPKYLSEVCKACSDKSAGEWIADITVSEIKHYLHNTTMPIREIATFMEFPNTSFFCQYTKKHLGMSPNRYRKQRRN